MLRKMLETGLNVHYQAWANLRWELQNIRIAFRQRRFDRKYPNRSNEPIWFTAANGTMQVRDDPQFADEVRALRIAEGRYAGSTK